MTTRILSYAFGAVVISSVWFYWLYLPLERQQEQLRAEVGRAEQQLEDFRFIMGLVPSYLEAQKVFEARRRALNSSLYAKQDILALFDHLRYRAQRKNLTVTEISPSVEELLAINRAVPDSTQVQFLNITLTLKGPYVNFGKFVDDLGESDFVRAIQHCRILGDKSRTREITFVVSFNALLGTLESAS